MSEEHDFASGGQAASGLSAMLRPPQWLLSEVQHRLVLLLNHVLMQEDVAMQRLAARSGCTVGVYWRDFHLHLLVTPAGLLDLAGPDAKADLNVTVEQEPVLQAAQRLLRGEHPPVRIEGDVQLASDVNWVIDNVRWDVEEDLSRIVGDPAAHALAGAARSAAAVLRRIAGGNATA